MLAVLAVWKLSLSICVRAQCKSGCVVAVLAVLNKVHYKVQKKSLKTYTVRSRQFQHSIVATIISANTHAVQLLEH